MGIRFILLRNKLIEIDNDRTVKNTDNKIFKVWNPIPENYIIWILR